MKKLSQKSPNFLQAESKISKEVADFLKKTEPQQIYEQLIEPIAWETSSEEASSVEKSIKEKLILHGNRQKIPPSYAKKVIDPLLEEVLMVATQEDNRELTKARFLEIFDDETTERVPNQHWQQYQQVLTTMMNTVSASFIGDSSDITIQFQSPIQTDIPPLYHDVVPRPNLLARIQAQLQSEGIAVIQGGVGKGKTTLAQLAANAINSLWRWLNLTGRNPSQVVQFSTATCYSS